MESFTKMVKHHKRRVIPVTSVVLALALILPQVIPDQSVDCLANVERSDQGDIGYSVEQTSDNGYIIAGRTRHGGVNSDDIFLVKLNEQADEQWKKTFGGAASDGSYSVQETTEGGYIIGGWTRSYGAGNDDALLIKTDADGNTEWEKTFGSLRFDGSHSARQTDDGGFIITGWKSSLVDTRSSDLWLIKTNADGEKEWERSFDGAKNDAGSCVEQTRDGGYIVSGWKRAYEGWKVDDWLIKTDAEGRIEWQKTYGGADVDTIRCVEQTTDGGFVTAGLTSSYGAGCEDFLLVKTDATGQELWKKTFGGASFDAASSVRQTTDEGFIIAGWTNSSAVNIDVLLIKTDSNGEELWRVTFGDAGMQIGHSVRQTSDRGYIVVGETIIDEDYGSEVLLLKIDAQGALQWEKTIRII